MRDERRTMLSLIAAGRMTASDALRLEAMWTARSQERRDEMREWLGALALCGLVVLLEWSQSGAGHTGWHGVLAVLRQIVGGVR
jgi:ferric-dicitrate binding protein FerR (iron transport regulator)